MLILHSLSPGDSYLKQQINVVVAPFRNRAGVLYPTGQYPGLYIPATLTRVQEEKDCCLQIARGLFREHNRRLLRGTAELWNRFVIEIW